MSSRVARVKTRPSVSRITGPSASAVRSQPSPSRTAKTGTPPSRSLSCRRLAYRPALSRAVPPSFACFTSRIARSVLRGGRSRRWRPDRPVNRPRDPDEYGMTGETKEVSA
jgi:hypothetical protein